MGRPSLFGPIDRNILAETGTPDFTGVGLHTSTQGIPIPIMWGTRRISPNVLWQSSVIDAGVSPRHVAIPTPPAYSQPSPSPLGIVWIGQLDVGTAGFNSYGTPDRSSSDSRFWVPMLFGLCEGPIDSIIRAWDGGGSPARAWAQIDLDHWPIVVGAPKLPHVLGVQYEIFPGSSTQAPWAFWAANPGIYPNQNLTYRGTAYIASPLVDCGHGRTIPQQSFDVVRTPNPAYALGDSYGIGTDYSLSTIIPDFLYNSQYGVDTAVGIDATSLLTFKQYQFAQGLYFSPLLTSQTSALDILSRWSVLSNSWIYWSGTQIMFAPLGDETITANGQTFTPDPTPAYNLGLNDFLEPGLSVNRADPIECFNRVRLEYSDRLNDYAKVPIEWKDSSLINQFGIRDASNIDAQDCCDVQVAAKIVELVGKRIAYIRNTYSFSLSYRYIRILPGTIVTVTDPNLGLNLVPVRVLTVDEDDKGALAITAEEYPGVIGISRPIPSQAWTPQANGVGGGSGGAGTPVGGGTGAPTPTSGGVLIMDLTMTLVLFVAGDVITLPASMPTGQRYIFKHDQLRVPQPFPAILESNPVTIQRPGGATYAICDPSDGSRSATSVRVRGPDDVTIVLASTGDGLVRVLA